MLWRRKKAAHEIQRFVAGDPVWFLEGERAQATHVIDVSNGFYFINKQELAHTYRYEIVKYETVIALSFKEAESKLALREVADKA